MINPFDRIDWNPDGPRIRTFALGVGAGLPAAGVLLLLALRWKHGAWLPATPLSVAIAGLLSGAVSLLVPPAGRLLYRGTYAISGTIGFLVGNALLALVYFVILTGTAFLLRLTGRNRMPMKGDADAKSYWKDAGEPPEEKRYFRQF